jgi:hypothetical protein
MNSSLTMDWAERASNDACEGAVSVACNACLAAEISTGFNSTWDCAKLGAAMQSMATARDKLMTLLRRGCGACMDFMV